MLLKKHIPVRYFLKNVWIDLLVVITFSTGTYLLRNYLSLDKYTVPLTIPAMLGTCISLLLAFRISQSYDRWWEARIVWGSIVNDSRTLLRQVMGFLKDGGVHESPDNDPVRGFALRQIAWCHVLSESLRGQDSSETLKRGLSPDEIEFVKDHDNKPNAILILQAQNLRSLYQSKRFTEFHQMQIDNTLTRLTDGMGRCERIKNTIFPRMYSIFVHRIIYLVVLMLPFGLIDKIGAWEIPLVALIGAAFLLVEQTAVLLQDPFENEPADTPMSTISRNIEINLRQMIGDHEVPEKLKPSGYFAQ